MEMTLENEELLLAETLARPDILIKTEPFPFFVAPAMLPSSLQKALQEDFPDLPGAGYLPYEKSNCGRTFNALIEHLQSTEFADAIGNTLGINKLSQYPTYVSISAKLNKRHGTIHTDGKSKIATILLYLNERWEHGSKGCLRFLNRIDDINDLVVPEIPPLFGTLVGFKRCDNSFHGHLPFEGERRVIQIAWITNREEMERKAKRGKLSRGWKKLLGWVDQKIGQGRKDNASRH